MKKVKYESQLNLRRVMMKTWVLIFCHRYNNRCTLSRDKRVKNGGENEKSLKIIQPFGDIFVSLRLNNF